MWDVKHESFLLADSSFGECLIPVVNCSPQEDAQQAHQQALYMSGNVI